MPYKTGQWGTQEKERNKKRLAYFRQASRGYRKNNHLKLKGEKIARKLLTGAKYVDKTSHDFEWDGLKVEVKYSNMNKDGRWRFHITSPEQKKADYFLLIYGLKKGYRAFMVPIEYITQEKCISGKLDRYYENRNQLE